MKKMPDYIPQWDPVDKTDGFVFMGNTKYKLPFFGEVGFFHVIYSNMEGRILVLDSCKTGRKACKIISSLSEEKVKEIQKKFKESYET